MSIVAAFAVPHPPLIIPAVGHGREEGIRATVEAYQEVAQRIERLAPQTIVLSSPHATCYRDYVHVSPGTGARGDFLQFGAPDAAYEADYDSAFVSALDAAAQADALSAGSQGERSPELDHGTLIPLHFVREAYTRAGHAVDFKLVRMGISGLSPADHYRMGMLVQRCADVLGRRVVYVASGDLSHKLLEEGPYGFAPEAPRFDDHVCQAFRSGSFLDLLTTDHSLAKRAAECGLRSFQIMAGALDQTEVKAELLSYEGPFGVGYGVAAFTPCGEERASFSRAFLPQYEEARDRKMRELRSHEDSLVRLARRAVETFVREGVRPDAEGLLDNPLAPEVEELSSPSGCFVSLTLNGELRGCIGTILPVRRNLAEEIVANALSAACHDPRFSPVRKDELSQLVYDVDVMGKPESISDASQLDPRRYGVIVSTSDGRHGLLLPDLDGVDGTQSQISIAARKGGISLTDDDWRLERFEVVRHR
ncbi:AmmeMemoRadiSam system protein A [Parafannyhessea umbonata]|uniref:Uncharacterized protein, PH0010 family/AmmeMemoRadiSam system protein A/AmmeMemoRadiSam system protein B n=1 Tax=Parafannyhessea umbonata TaxID=604330 RepID=A0A1H9Q6Z0_9ACTN|nr:AmmeMemoRadiSam system protein A [Parafannyhessea umbonata]SER56210.1 uncharacterized protein, PH0010 family/AmmeMemoRadiSam system protein A/AmmeMemoRadiSam system protein B [Parafannyhessea umbonata]